MSNTHLSAHPNDPYQWRESVLSTRSLSYLSVAADATRSRSVSGTTAHLLRRNTDMTDDSDYSLEMELNDIPELPDSVAESPLFLLPREIRDRVYAFCLTAEDNLPVEWPTPHKACHLQPQLARTCRIIHDEAAPLLYTLNLLTFHHPSDANMFVRAIASPSFAPHTSQLNLHIRAQDTRIWMSYLTSRDSKRSLEADFPHLRQLHIRFRSNKWNHSHTPEANLKAWSDDSRLDEIIDGVRNVYLPSGSAQLSKHERDIRNYFPPHGEATNHHSHRHTTTTAPPERHYPSPTIKVVCVCRVHTSHFNILTTDPPPPLPASPLNGPDLSNANNGTGVIQQTPPTIALPPDHTTPVKENDPFHGFAPIDLRSAPTKRLRDPDLGSTAIAQTVFADKNGVLLSLEIICLDPKKEPVLLG